MMIKAAVITISDRSSRGERQDSSGPLLRQLLVEAGTQVIAAHLIPDEADQISALLTRLADVDKVDGPGGHNGRHRTHASRCNA